MSRQSVGTAKRSAKIPRRTVKKGAKPIAKNARVADKSVSKSVSNSASKSARNPVGNSMAIKSRHSTKVASMVASMTASRIKNAQKTVSEMIRTASPPMQPVAAHEIVLKSHKYQVGETVYYTSPTFGRAAATGTYTVVKLLPSESDDYQYRIKSSGEAFERVAKESQLEKM
jgi:hypothetical protein